MLRRVVCVVVGFLLPPRQRSDREVAEVNGNVTDQTGSVMPGVTITLTQETTGLQRTVVTNESGRFSYLGINTWSYTRSRVSCPAFKTQTRNGGSQWSSARPSHSTCQLP